VSALLEVQNLSAGYGAVQVLRGVDLHVQAGELVALLGSNGAGKTTLNAVLSGLLPASAGTVRFDGQEFKWLSPRKVVQAGLIHVPEGRKVFPNLSVHENLWLGAFARARERRTVNLEKIFEIFPRLLERSQQLAGTLSGGEQQMLAIGRALLSKPALMMLDEPSLGLSPLLVQALFGLLKDLNRDGLSILLVEQNTHMALATAHRAYVLELGRLVLQGNAQDIAADPRMAAAYLGA